MPVYVWKGTNAYGEKRRGKLEAPNEAAARNQLKRMRLSISLLKEAPKDLLASISFFQPKVSGKDLVVFTRQLSTMIDAGLPLVQSLQILGDQQENSTFKKTIREVRLNVETGSTFAEALRKHPDIFDNLYCNMIEAGEVGGILDTICRRLASFMEKSQALQKKVKGAMTYPAISLGISLIVLVVMLVFVVPIFEAMFADFGSALPLPTQMVVDMSAFVQANFLFMLVGIFLLVFAIKKIYKHEKGRELIDSLLLKMPIIGPLLQRVAVAKFSRTLGTMLQSGVPILQALTVVARTAGNKVIEKAIFQVANSIREGRALAGPLTETGVFPGMVVQMISVGESTGALDAMLAKISDFYDEEVDQAVDNLTASIEPLMMVFLGGVIGGLVVAMYLPIFGMVAAIS